MDFTNEIELNWSFHSYSYEVYSIMNIAENETIEINIPKKNKMVFL